MPNAKTLLSSFHKVKDYPNPLGINPSALQAAAATCFKQEKRQLLAHIPRIAETYLAAGNNLFAITAAQR